MSGNSSSGSSPEVRSVGVVVVAAGSGQRMGGVRKQYLEILGEPVLLRATRPFLIHPKVSSVVVVLPPEDLPHTPGWLAELSVLLVAGGVDRADSVWNGLAALPAGTDLVLVHDGARPFVTREVIDRVIDCAPLGGAVAAIAATDTIKEVDSAGRIVATVPRARLWHAQTPQGFPLDRLRAAYAEAREEGLSATDDSALCEKFGLTIVVVEGDRDNIKITRPADLPIADAIARGATARVTTPLDL
jgi:2-C-methyl-D-erythritol 4-phosphate cytidylyltransferase